MITITNKLNIKSTNDTIISLIQDHVDEYDYNTNLYLISNIVKYPLSVMSSIFCVNNKLFFSYKSTNTSLSIPGVFALMASELNNEFIPIWKFVDAPQYGVVTINETPHGVYKISFCASKGDKTQIEKMIKEYTIAIWGGIDEDDVTIEWGTDIK